MNPNSPKHRHLHGIDGKPYVEPEPAKTRKYGRR